MFAVIGEALVDFVQSEVGGPYDARPGGGPLNIAVGLSRLGHPTQLLARLSTGPMGELLRSHVTRNGVGLDAAVLTEQQTTLALAGLDAGGNASYDFYVDGTADWGWTADELVLPAATRVVHTGSLATAVAPGADAILELFERIGPAGDVLASYDPNVRPALVGGRDEARARVERLVAACGVVKVSDEDVGWLYPGEDAVDVLRRWSHSGPALVVLTRGPQGCFATRPGEEPVEQPGLPVRVVDTIGAGDAFQSGLLSGLADCGAVTRREISSMSDEQLHSVLARATLVSAMTCERAGADPPTRAEYEAARERS